MLGQGLVRAVWTEDETLPTRISGHITHYTGRPNSPGPSRTGSRPARRATRTPRPSGWAGQSRFAHKSGNKDTASLLVNVVDVIDPATGTVRLKAKV